MSLAIAMAAAAPMADRDDSGDIKTARFLEDLTDRGQVQTKRRALGIYGPLYFDRHQPVQEVCNSWLHILCVIVTTGRKIVDKLTTCMATIFNYVMHSVEILFHFVPISFKTKKEKFLSC